MKKIGLTLMAVMVSLTGVAMPAMAAPSDDVIKINCRSAQSILSQMEKTDAALRINRGRVYNEIIDLLYAMNARLASNKISAPKLASLTSDFEGKLNDFRSNYNSYDDELNSLTSMKCQDKPADFYESLNKVRDSRTTLNSDIKELDKLLGDYQTEFNTNTRALIDAR